MTKEKKKSKLGSHLISISFFTLMGVLLGFAMIAFLEWQLPEGIPSGKKATRTCFMLVFLYLSWVLQVVIHEAGHLICGLLSGYTFSSFRIGSMMILKENGRFVTKRLKIAGTGGQCLMAPPVMVNGKFPVVLYNLGGSILNLVVSLLFVPVLIAAPKGGLLALFSFLMIAVGIISCLGNGIPLHTKTVDNDGYNAISLGKSKEAMEAFWLQMSMNQQLSQGKRLKDMPDEWFRMPSDEAMKVNLVAAIGVSVCNRLMDQHRFEEADERMAHILDIESGMIGLHRNLIICDRMYCEMIHQNRQDVLAQFCTKEQKKFMKAMGSFPSVIRTEYAYAVLVDQDQKKAAKFMDAFERVAKTYPYPNDINSERELIQIVDEKVSA